MPGWKGWNDFIFPSAGFRDKSASASPALSSSRWNIADTMNKGKIILWFYNCHVFQVLMGIPLNDYNPASARFN